jgi:hypothetical protein
MILPPFPRLDLGQVMAWGSSEALILLKETGSKWLIISKRFINPTFFWPQGFAMLGFSRRQAWQSDQSGKLDQKSSGQSI